MYLFIFEDGNMSQQDSYGEDDLKAVSDGLLDIVCFDEPSGLFYQLDEDGDFTEVLITFP